jgi:phosphatidylglycerophosphate synthase
MLGSMATFSLDDVRAVCKRRDAWWTVLLVDPIATRLAWVVANWTAITPNQITLTAFTFGLGAAGCFVQGSAMWLALGALLYHLGFVLDCIDVKIARLKGTGSPFGAWLDFMLDRVRDGICALALAIGQFHATGRLAYVWLGFAILALDMLRYINGPQIAKARRRMANGHVADARMGGGRKRSSSKKPQSRERRLRRSLQRRRIRPHLFSGIEFQMATFIVAPLTGAIILVTATAGIMMLVFEFLLVYRFWRGSRAYARRIEAEGPAVPHASVPAPRTDTETLSREKTPV